MGIFRQALGKDKDTSRKLVPLQVLDKHLESTRTATTALPTTVRHTNDSDSWILLHDTVVEVMESWRSQISEHKHHVAFCMGQSSVLHQCNSMPARRTTQHSYSFWMRPPPMILYPTEVSAWHANHSQCRQTLRACYWRMWEDTRKCHLVVNTAYRLGAEGTKVTLDGGLAQGANSSPELFIFTTAPARPYTDENLPGYCMLRAKSTAPAWASKTYRGCLPNYADDDVGLNGRAATTVGEVEQILN